MPKTSATKKKPAVKPQAAAAAKAAQKPTFEDVWLTIKETQASIKETRASMKETQAALDASIDRITKETNASLDRIAKENQASIKKMEASIDRVTKETNASIGRLGNKLGEIMESLMVPDLVARFRRLGYQFEHISRNHEIEDVEHDIIMEIDALLENGDCAMAVEVKVTLSDDDVKDHIVRMEKLRRHATLHNDNRTFYAAMAAAVIPKDTRIFTLKQGFYLIEVSGENIKITKPFNEPKAF